MTEQERKGPDAMSETMQERWARQDAFIGPQLPGALREWWEVRADRHVLTCTGRWWAKPLHAIGAQGPFRDLLEARTAPLDLSRP